MLVYHDGAGNEKSVHDATTVEGLRAHILEKMQTVMGRLPDGSRRCPLDVKIVDTTDAGSYLRQRITYAPEPHDRVPAYLLIPKHAILAPAMVCLHQTTPLGKDEPAGLGGLENLHYARELVERGFVCIVPDYCTLGENKSDPYRLGYKSGTMKGIWNHMRAVDVLQSMKEVNPERIGCIGHSLGGHNTLFLGAFDRRIRVLVSSCGFSSFQRDSARYGGDGGGWSGERYMPAIATGCQNDFTRVPFDFPEVLAALAPRPLFVNAPRNDDNFDPDGVDECIQAVTPLYRLLGATDAIEVCHPDALHDFPVSERGKAYRFIERHLKGRGLFPGKRTV